MSAKLRPPRRSVSVFRRAGWWFTDTYRAWTAPIPIYVTRKNANTETGTVTVGAGLALIGVLLVQLNVLLWSSIALYEGVRFIVG